MYGIFNYLLNIRHLCLQLHLYINTLAYHQLVSYLDENFDLLKRIPDSFFDKYSLHEIMNLQKEIIEKERHNMDMMRC
jgi:hypothetical protein